ncbi:MAG: Unknown protein [uncultured Thiotrichaceae bacterium]|uniref:HTH cro/C1-type domain-containing protein n=1 Tax=uncultured Thiotrichaceae bacterium TaxID=298394 RepID=A0A6S6SH53_9GAMM|nr:MAG: Unknown protein [uncultured Thiotrichaceae bacterium]
MTEKYNSVWDELEKDPVQAANLKLRSSLMREISKFVESQELTQAEAAKKLGTTQPRLNDVLKGKIDKCTVDRLVNMLESVGYHVELSVLKVA